MSDLTATNCGCGKNCGCGINSGLMGGNCIWIILLLLFCGGCGSGGGLLGGGCDHGCDNNSSCDIIIWILLISCLCGGSGGGLFGGGSCC